jgi:polyisoprenoid-binding protein YceI
MVKKTIAIVGSLIVIGVIIIMVVPWGSYESNLEKSDLTEKIDFDSDSTNTSTPSLDELEGKFAVDITKGGNAEIIFDTEGLKATKGGFEDFNISFDIANDFSQSQLEVNIKTESLNTGNEMRDEHLREAEFFDAGKYPQILFKSSTILLGDTSYIAKGQLTLNGTSKDLEIPFLHVGAGGKGELEFEAFEGAFEFNRIDYGQEESSGVGNIVKIKFYCELSKY